MALPFEPETVESLIVRGPIALTKLWDCELIMRDPDAPRPGLFRAFVFDFEDGWRIVVSREKGQHGSVSVQMSGAWFPRSQAEVINPRMPVLGLMFPKPINGLLMMTHMISRLRLLLEEVLDGQPIQVLAHRLEENGVMHVVMADFGPDPEEVDKMPDPTLPPPIKLVGIDPDKPVVPKLYNNFDN